MKRILSLLIAALMLCCTVYGAPSMAETQETAPNTSKAEALTATRNIGGSKSMIRTMSKETAAKYESMGTKWDNVNDTYNEYDVAKLREFLEIEDANGVKNGEKIVRIEGDYYDPDDPSTWSCLGWTPEGFLHHISFWAANFAEPDETGMYKPQDLLVGTLDVSGMQELVDVNIPENLISGVIADDCPCLEMFYCGNSFTTFQSQCTVVSAKNCPNLLYIGADACKQNSVDIDGCESLVEIFMDDTKNLSEMSFDSCRGTIQSVSFSFGGLASADLSNMSELAIAHFDSSSIKSINLENNDSYFELSVCDTEVTELDLSDCVNLYGLFIQETGITELDLSSCVNLDALNGDASALISLDASSSECLSFLALQEMPDFHSLRIKPYGYILDVNIENGKLNQIVGAFDFMGTINAMGILAEPDDEAAEFIGWYDAASNELICSDPYLDFPALGLIDLLRESPLSLIARFSGGEEPIPGDINGNGEVEVSDAIMALRCAMGLIELDEAQFAAGDMNGNGTIEVTDAIMILRIAMGIN